MTNKIGNITISVPNNTTEEDIKEIRKEYNKSELSKKYRLSIIINGDNDPVSNLGSFLSAYVKK